MKYEVPMKIEFRPAWLSWVGSTTMCLNALDVECDMADVAGYSSYAFALAIHEGLCPSGPTLLEWSTLASGIAALGRSTTCFISYDCFTQDSNNKRTRAHAIEVFELVTREIEAGRPCIVWGLGPPEFGVVRGVTEDDYLCVPGGPTPKRLRWDAIDAPGGPSVLAFPTARENPENWDIDREAIRSAVMMMTRPDYRQNTKCGLKAYDYWCSELQDEKAISWSNSYNAQCWAEARMLGSDFLKKVADRHKENVDIGKAHESLRDVAVELGAVAEMFPFTMRFEGDPITDKDVIETAVEHLQAAKAAEEKAIESMNKALQIW
ncbi:MAG: hypothetical protein HN356_14660 [Calditrichaeota bacterium]|nr:hypothetical protein [Calditrichota bacterium]MBT7789263.1 hypothetical protein [Calditrichota bacterium]